MEGLVVKNSGNSYWVKASDGQLIECKIKGRFRLKGIKTTNPIAIGDRVRFKKTNEDLAFIYEILERRNYIIRRSINLSKQAHILAANMDLAVLIVTINHPVTYTTFIDRFLATAEAYRIPACLVFNKIDCFDKEELRYLDAMIHLYSSLDYPCFKISALQPETLSDFINFLEGKVVLFSGNSGVGKSTLINAIAPGSNAKTGDISQMHNTGIHTTTLSEMYEMKTGGYIIDTPGIKGFGTFDMQKNEVSHYFKELFSLSKNCKFNNCTHIHEPGCAVLQALKNHQVAQSRYQSYLSILEDVETGKYRE